MDALSGSRTRPTTIAQNPSSSGFSDADINGLMHKLNIPADARGAYSPNPAQFNGLLNTVKGQTKAFVEGAMRGGEVVNLDKEQMKALARQLGAESTGDAGSANAAGLLEEAAGSDGPAVRKAFEEAVPRGNRSNGGDAPLQFNQPRELDGFTDKPQGGFRPGGGRR